MSVSVLAVFVVPITETFGWSRGLFPGVVSVGRSRASARREQPDQKWGGLSPTTSPDSWPLIHAFALCCDGPLLTPSLESDLPVGVLTHSPASPWDTSLQPWCRHGPGHGQAPQPMEVFSEPVHDLLSRSARKASATMVRRVWSVRAPCFPSLRHCSRQANARSTTQRVGRTAKGCRARRGATAPVAPRRSWTPEVQGAPGEPPSTTTGMP